MGRDLPERTEGRTSLSPGAVDQLVVALSIITPVSNSPSIKALTFNGDVELFTCQIQDVAKVSGWTEKTPFLHLRSCLGGKASVYGCSGSIVEIFESLRTRNGVSTRQAKELLLGLKRDSQKSVFDVATEIKRVVSVAYLSMHVDKREQPAVDL